MFAALMDVPGAVYHGVVLVAFVLLFVVVEIVRDFCSTVGLLSRDPRPRHGDEFWPWRENHQAVVYWDSGHTDVMRRAFEDTANMLGVKFRHTDDIGEANIKVWVDRRRLRYGQFGAVWGLSQEDRPTSSHGVESGNIYLFPGSWGLRRFCETRISDYALTAHESAHLLAGVGHFGEGLMVAGEDYQGAEWFTVHDLEYMQNHVRDFRQTCRDGVRIEPSVS